jgi:hypothetical protein
MYHAFISEYETRELPVSAKTVAIAITLRNGSFCFPFSADRISSMLLNAYLAYRRLGPRKTLPISEVLQFAKAKNVVGG